MRSKSNYLVFMVLIVVLTAGCATMQSRWEKTQSTDSITAYEDFLNSYSKGEFADEARARLEDLYLQRAKNANTVEAYQNFLERYQKGKYAEEARELMDPLLFEAAKSENTSVAYENYINVFPEGKYVETAEKMMVNARYIETIETNTVNGYEDFLQNYPDSDYTDDILERLKDKLLEELMQSLAEELIKKFLERFPEGKHADRARVLGNISQLRNNDEKTRINASRQLVRMGEDLNRKEIKLIDDIMRSGTESWKKHLYRRGHCTWYEKTSAKYYAADTMLNIKSRYVTSEMKKEARAVKNKEKYEYRVTDPGWICY